MQSKKFHVTLSEDTEKLLRDNGRGSISAGIEAICRDWSRGIAPKPEAARVDVMAARRQAKEVEAARLEEAYARSSIEFEIVQVGHLNRDGNPYTVDDMNRLFDGNERAELFQKHIEHMERIRKSHEESDRLFAAHKAEQAKRVQIAATVTEKQISTANAVLDFNLKEPPPVQTLRLSVDALRRMELFGTPETMTDEQITECNDYYANTPAEPEYTEET